MRRTFKHSINRLSSFVTQKRDTFSAGEGKNDVAVEQVLRYSRSEDMLRRGGLISQSKRSRLKYRMIADTDETKYKLRFKILEVAEEFFH